MKNKLIAEGIGTFFLYLIIGLCVVPGGAGAFAPISVGIGLIALVYSCGHISKAHFNPATTVTYLCAGTHATRAFTPYILVIFLSAILAAGAVELLVPEALALVKPLTVKASKIMIAEFLFTFILMWVILNVAIAKGTPGNQFYGLAIGTIVTAAGYAVGAISFAALNPAVTLGLCINGFIPWNALIIYIPIQFVAAALAGSLFRQMNLVNETEFANS